MTDFRKLAFVGLMSLGVATVGSAGCSSSSSSGTGGSTGTGGTGTGTGGTHTGGSTGTGGTGAGTGGAAGATRRLCGCPMRRQARTSRPSRAPTPALPTMGGYLHLRRYPQADLHGRGAGSVNVMDTVQLTAAAHYQGFGMYFNGNSAGTDCIDAHTYTGVQFDISGSLTGTGCTMQFSINDSEHAIDSLKSNAGTDDPKAAGPKGSYAPQLPITSAQLTSTSTTVKVPFTGASAPTGGSPATAIDPTKIEGVQWQMSHSGAGRRRRDGVRLEHQHREREVLLDLT